MASIRGYIRPVSGLSEAAQDALLRKAGATVVYVDGKHGDKGTTARQAWLKALDSKTVAAVARLDVIAEFTGRRGGSEADLVATILDIVTTAEGLLDASVNVSSRDGRFWKSRVEWARKYVREARRPWRKPKPPSTRGGAFRVAATAILNRWREPGMEAHRLQFAHVWRDRTYRGWKEARAALPEELRGLSLNPLMSLFGNRRPDLKGVGGRPRKRKK